MWAQVKKLENNNWTFECLGNWLNPLELVKFEIVKWDKMSGIFMQWLSKLIQAICESDISFNALQTLQHHDRAFFQSLLLTMKAMLQVNIGSKELKMTHKHTGEH